MPPPSDAAEARITNKPSKSIFVIMPFTATPTRSESDLSEFYTTNLKHRIECDNTLRFQYWVRRSDDTFNITERIIRDLYEADIVFCDLSGHAANPNVMYELGVRLASTDKPVILFREASKENQRIFDIQGFYAFEYSPTKYRQLEEHLIEKLRKLENDEEHYASPVLRVLAEAPSVVTKVKKDAAIAMLRMMARSVHGAQTGMAVSLGEFLIAEGRALPDNGSVLNAILSAPDEFTDVNWVKLRVMPTAPPAVHAFLSQPLLQGLLKPADVDRIVDFVADFYGQFFSTDTYWVTPSLAKVINYASHITSLGVGILILADCLEATSEEDREGKLASAMGFFAKPFLSVELSMKRRALEASAGRASTESPLDR